MSANLFNLLGNDVEDVDTPAPREIVKKQTSTKKADVPPPSANKARANKSRSKPTGNEAAIKDKSAGRAANKSVDAPDAKKLTRGPKTDRHSKTGKADSAKKVKQAGWTADGKSELENELEGAEDAAEELEAEDKPIKKSLEDYLKEKEEFVGSSRSARKVQAADDEKIITKTEESFIAPTKTKNVKAKPLKVKNVIEFSATFSDEAPAPRSNTHGGFRGGARGRGNGRGRGRGNGPRPSNRGARGDAKPVVNDDDFPSLS